MDTVQCESQPVCVCTIVHVYIQGSLSGTVLAVD